MSYNPAEWAGFKAPEGEVLQGQPLGGQPLQGQPLGGQHEASTMSHNGHKNYETWAVSMYLDGNYTSEHTYLEVREIVREERGSMYQLADALREYVVEQTVAESIDGLACDLLAAALSNVDWRALASNLIDELEPEEE